MHTRREEMKQIGRLLKRADFLRVQGAGRKWVTPTITMQMAPLVDAGPGITVRYGITVTKKIFKHAVDRNRVRRRIRPIMLALLVENTPIGQDIVLLPREAALNAPPETLEKDLKWAVKRLMDPDFVQKPAKTAKKQDKKV